MCVVAALFYQIGGFVCIGCEVSKQAWKDVAQTEQIKQAMTTTKPFAVGSVMHDAAGVAYVVAKVCPKTLGVRKIETVVSRFGSDSAESAWFRVRYAPAAREDDAEKTQQKIATVHDDGTVRLGRYSTNRRLHPSNVGHDTFEYWQNADTDERFVKDAATGDYVQMDDGGDGRWPTMECFAATVGGCGGEEEEEEECAEQARLRLMLLCVS